MITYKKTNFLFTGDMPHSMGVKLCEDYSDLKMDLLKVPHHGEDKESKCFLKLLNKNIQLFQ